MDIVLKFKKNSCVVSIKSSRKASKRAITRTLLVLARSLKPSFLKKRPLSIGLHKTISKNLKTPFKTNIKKTHPVQTTAKTRHNTKRWACSQQNLQVVVMIVVRYKEAVAEGVKGFVMEGKGQTVIVVEDIIRLTEERGERRKWQLVIGI